MSVTTQSHDLSPPPAMNSSADANPWASYPSEPSDSASAIRNELSSSMTAIRGSRPTHHPLPRFRPQDREIGNIFLSHRARPRKLYTSMMFTAHVGHPDVA